MILSRTTSWTVTGKHDQFEIRLAKQSGGKAGKGHNKTSTIQVLSHSLLVKSFRFRIGEPGSKSKAILRAKSFVLSRIA